MVLAARGSEICREVENHQFRGDYHGNDALFEWSGPWRRPNLSHEILLASSGQQAVRGVFSRRPCAPCRGLAVAKNREDDGYSFVLFAGCLPSRGSIGRSTRLIA